MRRSGTLCRVFISTMQGGLPGPVLWRPALFSPAGANPGGRALFGWPAGCHLGFQPHGHHLRRLGSR
jgi:hypothetical protein